MNANSLLVIIFLRTVAVNVVKICARHVYGEIYSQIRTA